jgi:hypothetical protein
MTVGLRAEDLEGIGRSGGDGGALQHLAQSLNFGRMPIGEIGDGAVVDLSLLAEGLPEKDGGRGVAIGHNRYVHVDIIPQEIAQSKDDSHTYMTTLM